MSDMLVSGYEERRVLPDDRRGQHVGVPRESADRQPIAVDCDLSEPGDTIDVDEPLRRDHP